MSGRADDYHNMLEVAVGLGGLYAVRELQGNLGLTHTP